MSIYRGVAVDLDAGTEVCGALELAWEDGHLLAGRVLAACEHPPVLVWLGKTGLCEDHVLAMWPELATS